MKNLILFFSILLLGQNSFVFGMNIQNSQNDKNPLIKIEKDISGVKKINVSGFFKIYINQGETEKIEVEVSQGLHKNLVIKKKGQLLQLELQKKVNLIRKHELNVHLTLKNIQDIDVSGVCQVIFENTFVTKEMKIKASGAVSIEGDIKVTDFDLNLSGAVSLKLSGQSNQSKIEVSGAVSLNCFDFIINHLNFESSGVCSSKVNVLESLNAELSAVSVLSYKGRPTKVVTNISTMSKLIDRSK